MNKSTFFLFLSAFILFSCTNNKQNHAIPSVSKINTITVVIDNKLWNGEIGDSLRNKFASPIESLSSEEPLFDVNQYESQLLEGFVSNNRNIIIVGKDSIKNFYVKKNQFATPQNIFYINGKSYSDILQIIEKKAPYIIQVVKKEELKRHQLLLSDSLRNPKDLKKKFKIAFKIPKKYKIVKEESNFIWLKHDMINGSTNLLVAQLPSNNIDFQFDFESHFVKIFDSIGQIHVKGKSLHSTMSVDPYNPIYYSKIVLDHQEAYEIKGTWRLKNSYMRGPFIAYFVTDKRNNHVFFLNGFCYFPSHEERDYLHELESIFKGIKLN